MRLLTRVILLALFISIPRINFSQIDLCADKRADIVERARKIVDEYIQLVAVSEEGIDIRHEITDISKILYNYEKEYYFLKITTVRTLEGTNMRDAEYLSAIEEHPELDFILRINQIDRLIPEITTEKIGNNAEIPDLPAREVKIIQCAPKVMPLTFDMPPGTVIKKSSENTIEWIGGTREDILVIDLVKFDKLGNIQKVINLAVDYSNTGYYPKWEIDRKIKPGIYKIRLQKIGSNEEPVWSEEFRIKTKIPTVLKVGVPIVVIGTAVLIACPWCEDDKGLPEPPIPER